MFFAASQGSLLLRNFERRIAGGEGERVPDLVRDLHGLSRRGQFTPEGWEGYLYAICIERLFLSR